MHIKYNAIALPGRGDQAEPTAPQRVGQAIVEMNCPYHRPPVPL
jgi:hypothetical protein